MKNQFVTIEIAIRMKQLGFKENCFAYTNINNDFIKQDNYFDYNDLNDNIVSLPLWQQVEDWLRKDYSIYYNIKYNYDTKSWWSDAIYTNKELYYCIPNLKLSIEHFNRFEFTDYEEARIDTINYILNTLIK